MNPHNAPGAGPAAVAIETLRRAADARGQVFEPLDAAGLAGQQNVHVVLTAPGHVRGNHFHTRGTEVTVVVGPAQVRLREGGQLRDVDVPDGEAWRFTIPPGVTHAYRGTGAGTMVLVAFNSRPHDPADPDTTRDPIL
jgi:UDP-2-acetamido-2,6-beta-L-arabino-hexul-4-ose reductase